MWSIRSRSWPGLRKSGGCDWRQRRHSAETARSVPRLHKQRTALHETVQTRSNTRILYKKGGAGTWSLLEEWPRVLNTHTSGSIRVLQTKIPPRNWYNGFQRTGCSKGLSNLQQCLWGSDWTLPYWAHSRNRSPDKDRAFGGRARRVWKARYYPCASAS